MTSVSHKNRGHDLVKKYQSHLESRIEKGDQSLVCRDEKICKEAETLLTKGNAQKILKLDGLDSLTVMENSLQAFPFKTGRLGLEKISKAFEVLELAALNLYLYPWRKEYKFVKVCLTILVLHLGLDVCNEIVFLFLLDVFRHVHTFDQTCINPTAGQRAVWVTWISACKP